MKELIQGSKTLFNHSKQSDIHIRQFTTYN